MENAADALKLGFALLVFVIAITLTFSVIGQARAVSDIVFTATDKTNFYDYGPTIFARPYEAYKLCQAINNANTRIHKEKEM